MEQVLRLIGKTHIVVEKDRGTHKIQWRYLYMGYNEYRVTKRMFGMYGFKKIDEEEWRYDIDLKQTREDIVAKLNEGYVGRKWNTKRV